MLTYNSRLRFCCQLPIHWKQKERKSNMPFKNGGSTHSSIFQNWISLSTGGTLNYCFYAFTPSLYYYYYVTEAFSSFLCSSSYWPMDFRPGLVTCFGQLNVGNMTVCQFWAKALRGIVCFYTLLYVLAITIWQAHPREPRIRHIEQTQTQSCFLEPTSAEPRSVQGNLSQLLSQWIRTTNILCEPLRFRVYLLKWLLNILSIICPHQKHHT